jgi:ABC-type Fe3+ transport system substrate-binding protein
VVAKVALGEADAGIVYRSDVTPDLADRLTALPIPDQFNTLATYPIAVTDNASQPELARRFVDFVLSDAGQDILVEWGFVSVRDSAQPQMLDHADQERWLRFMSFLLQIERAWRQSTCMPNCP